MLQLRRGAGPLCRSYSATELEEEVLVCGKQIAEKVVLVSGKQIAEKVAMSELCRRS